MELILKFTQEELRLLSSALHIAVIHTDDDGMAEIMNTMLKILRPFSGQDIEQEAKIQ